MPFSYSENVVIEQRKAIRFDLKLPLEIIRGAEHQFSETRNLSSNGVLFAIEHDIEPGNSIEYVITLPSKDKRPVRLRCLGKVVRRANGQGLAATIDRYEFIRG
jgi:hypothetical protein